MKLFGSRKNGFDASAGTKLDRQESACSPAKTAAEEEEDLEATELIDEEEEAVNEYPVAGQLLTAKDHQNAALIGKRQIVDLDAEDLNYQSDKSVGENTESSHGTPLQDGSATETKQRMSALTRTMTIKQSAISKEFNRMVKKMSDLVRTSYDMAEGEEDALDYLDSKEKAVAKKKAKRAMKEMKDQAEVMTSKSDRISKQFETIVIRMEQDRMTQEKENQRLKRQLNMARMMLKEEGIVLDDISDARALTAATSGSTYTKSLSPSASPSGTPRSALKNLPPRTALPTPKSSLRSARSNTPSSLVSTEIFSIKEISFCSTVVDVAELTTGPLTGPSLPPLSSAEEAPPATADGESEYLRFLL